MPILGTHFKIISKQLLFQIQFFTFRPHKLQLNAHLALGLNKEWNTCIQMTGASGWIACGVQEHNQICFYYQIFACCSFFFFFLANEFLKNFKWKSLKLTKHYQVNNKDCMEDTINNMVNQSREPISILERHTQIDTLREKERE